MFSTPSQYTNYKIRGKSRHLHYPYYGLYNLSYCFYIWLRDFISRYLFITSTERFSGVVSTELMPCCFKVETISRFSNTNFSATREEQKAMAFQTWKKAQAALDVAKKSFDRVQKLFENDVVSAQKRDEAEANYKAMLATEQAAKAQYEMAKNGAEKEDKLAPEAQVNRARGAVEEVSSYIKETFLISPISGEISERYPKVGELVGTGSPVMSVLDLEDMWVVFNVREDLLGDLKMGTVFTGYIPALNNKEVQLKVTHMKNMGTYAAWRATKTTGQYDAKTFEVKAVPSEKVEGLRPGMSVLKRVKN